MSFQVITRGFEELAASFENVKTSVDPVLGAELRRLADPVKAEAQSLARGWSSAGAGQARTAAGLRVRRRNTSVRVEQGLGKTTGLHGNYGGIQMRHFLLPPLGRHQAEIEAGAERVIGKLVDI